MNDQSTTSRWLYPAALSALFLAAILLQIALLSAEPMLLRDGIFYAERIQNHVECGKSFVTDDFNKPPLLLICGSFLCRYSRLSVESVLLGMNILSHALLVFPIVATEKRLFHSRQAALFCALLAICTPSLLITALGGIREPFFFLLAACSLAAITAFCNQCSIPALVTGGICAAIGFFARYESLFLLPQTILYRKEENRQRAIRSYDSCRHAIFLARDKISAQTAKEMFSHLPVALYPDIVTTLIGQYHPQTQRNGIFFCVRNDLEKLYSEQAFQKYADILQQTFNMPISFGDTNMDTENHLELINNVKFFVDKFVEKFAKYRLVITDRYHGTIFSLIANTPVIVIPSNDHKVTTGVDWFKGVYDDRFALAKNLQEVPALAEKFLTAPALPPPEPYFKAHYYDRLKELVERCVREK